MDPIKLNQENFETIVAQSDRPVLVDFWAEWCGPCKMLNPVLKDIAAEAGGRVAIAKINVDEEPELASRFRVQSIPTLVVFKNGAEQSRLVGLAPKRKILEQLSLN